MKRAGTFALVLLCALGALADATTPNLARGFDPEKAYAVDEVGVVNLFNGNLNVSIPIGINYPVSSSLSYSLTLQYGGNNWEYQTDTDFVRDENGEPICHPEGDRVECEMATYGWAYPTDLDNAGFGWRLNLGRLTPLATAGTGIGYESPDGAVHEFYPTLHPGETATANVWYTRDNSYLRMTKNGNLVEIESPDGLIRSFDDSPGHPSGNRITRIRDRFGKSVTVDYNDTAAPAPTFSGAYTAWHISDSQGRHHYVYLRPTATYHEDQQNVPVQHWSVAEVRLQMPGGDAIWKLHYVGESNGTWATLPRPCFDSPVVTYPHLGYFVQAPILERIVPPEGNPFVFTYEMAGSETGPCAESSGILTSVTLPTLGKVGWRYALHHYPAASHGVVNHKNPRSMTKSVAVRERTVHDAAGNLAQFRTYTAVSDTLLPGTAPLEKSVTVTDYKADQATILRRTRSFFSLCSDNCPSGVNQGEYSLPFTRKAQSGSPAGTDAKGRLLSTITYGPNGNWSEPMQWTYVGYEADVSLATTPIGKFDFNRRLLTQRTVHASPHGEEWVDSESTNFDGLGHYRKTTLTSSFDPTVRETVRNYNPSAGTLGAGGTAPFTMLPASAKWLLELFDYARTTETGQQVTTVRSEHCFDPNTGFEKRRRTLRGSSPARNDLLTIFEDDNTGDVRREKHYGGDSTLLQSGFATCTSIPVLAPSYTVQHGYSYGVRNSTQFAGTAYKTLDVDVHPAGMPMTSRDVSGIATTYQYDLLGRITEIRPRDSAWSHFQYLNAGGTSTRASVRVRQFPKDASVSSTPLTEARHYYDFLGRLLQQRTFLGNAAKQPSLPWSATSIVYDAFGRRDSTTVTVGASSGDYGTFTAPRTTTQYDALGRVRQIVQPDGKSVDTVYSGASAVMRSVSLGTAAGPTTVETTELLDAQGRLAAVIEDSTNSRIRTDYQYDARGKLRKVHAGDQVRTFVYDGAGLLTLERHPEIAGDVTYAYDALGNIITRSDPEKAINMTYDAAGRVKSVGSGGALLQEFAYGPSDSMGKMSSSTRHNRHPELGGNGDITVVETYAYDGPDGRLSTKQTTVSTGQTFTDSYTYDPLGAVASIVYPQCSGCGTVSGPPRSVQNSHTNGHLTAVPGYTAANGILYHPNGLLASLQHVKPGNLPGPLFEQQLAADGMARPGATTLSGLCTPPDAAITAPASLALGGEGTATVAGDGTYVWTIQNGTITSSATAKTITFRAGCSGETVLSVTVTSSCSAAGTRTVSVTRPAINVSSSPTRITAGASSTLTVTSSLTPWSLRWADLDQTLSSNGTTITRSVTPTFTQTYEVTTLNGCAGSWGATSVIVKPPAPATLTAVPYGTGTRLQWTIPAGADVDSYEVHRCQSTCDSAANFALVGESTQLWYDDNPPPSHAYIYFVRSKKTEDLSDPSPTTFRGLFPFAEVVTAASLTPVRLAHVTELRTAVNALRTAAGLPPASYSGGTAIAAVHFSELRAALNAARAQLGFPQADFVDPQLQPGLTPFRADHLNQLRQYVRGVQ